jgi:hypothetical protein
MSEQNVEGSGRGLLLSTESWYVSEGTKETHEKLKYSWSVAPVFEPGTVCVQIIIANHLAATFIYTFSYGCRDVNASGDYISNHS